MREETKGEKGRLKGSKNVNVAAERSNFLFLFLSSSSSSLISLHPSGAFRSKKRLELRLGLGRPLPRLLGSGGHGGLAEDRCGTHGALGMARHEVTSERVSFSAATAGAARLC